LFTQGGRSAGYAQGGLGIGLALVRSLVELHNGRVEAFSDGPGHGSAFVLHLPLAEAARAVGDARAGAVSAPQAQYRLLVVDDNRDAADSLALLLESSHAAEVQVAYDGHSALEALVTFKPEAVLLDLGMPAMDGYEVARRMRQHPHGEGIALIALTGWGQDEDRRRTRRAGFDHHLVKPVDPELLRTLLATWAAARKRPMNRGAAKSKRRLL
jgi:CheY-like chemotaxis protein